MSLEETISRNWAPSGELWVRFREGEETLFGHRESPAAVSPAGMANRRPTVATWLRRLSGSVTAISGILQTTWNRKWHEEIGKEGAVVTKDQDLRDLKIKWFSPSRSPDGRDSKAEEGPPSRQDIQGVSRKT